MKTIASGLQAQIDDGTICTLFSIEAQDGTVRYFTDHNNALTVDGNSYTPSAGVSRQKMTVSNNAEVSNQDIAATILDMPEGELKSGKWDNAKIEVALCGWKNPSAGKLVVFSGRIGVIQWTDMGFRADIQNYLRDLNKNIGALVTAGCRHQLYSTSSPKAIGFCGVNKAANTVTGTVDFVLTQRIKFKIASTTKPTGWGSAGFLKFTSGPNAGLSYTVKIHEVAGYGESVELYTPCIGQVTVGTTFELSAGCDHTFETCKTKFSNAANFGGFPHLQVDVNSRVEGG
jgi:uncharacterized phage protein (TIGR02218 family)